jgi:hypothetical protein
MTYLWEILRDPMGFAAGDANLYRYVGNAPTNVTDPTGLDAWTRIGGGLQFVFGLGETLVGGGLIIVPEPTLTKVGGVLIAAHGIDNTMAGWNPVVERPGDPVVHVPGADEISRVDGHESQ